MEQTERDFFYQQISKLQRRCAVSHEEYNSQFQLLTTPHVDPNWTAPEKAKYYHLKASYKIATIADINRIVRIKNEQLLIHDGELYDHLLKIHLSIGHGLRDAMVKHTGHLYNVPVSVITAFCDSCLFCKGKRRGVVKGLVVKPILSKDYGSRSQLDLIDMQSQPDGDYKFILNYQDHLTKYLLLRPLKRKTAEAVVKKVKQIFADFCPPRILHTDNGREFDNGLLESLCKDFNVELVHGKARHSQSQGSVERANQDVENILMTEMRERKSGSWKAILPVVQFKKNSKWHRGINQSPAEALFGRKPITQQPEALMPAEDTQVATDGAVGAVCAVGAVGDQTQDNNDDQIIIAPPPQFGDQTEEEEKSENEETELTSNQNNVEQQRDLARKTQSAQADKMVDRTNRQQGVVTVGSCCMVSVNDLDRGKVDARSLIAVVMAIDNALYKLGTSEGILPQWYTRNQFRPIISLPLSVEKVPNVVMKLRTIATVQSVGTGQGIFACSCTKKPLCQTNLCKCFKNNRLCNSKCHSKNSNANCRNKQIETETVAENVVEETIVEDLTELAPKKKRGRPPKK